MPRISVVIPTYNRCILVTNTNDSVLAQMYADYEVIVVDNGSTDATASVIGNYGPKVRYIYQRNRGRVGARPQYGY